MDPRRCSLIQKKIKKIKPPNCNNYFYFIMTNAQEKALLKFVIMPFMPNSQLSCQLVNWLFGHIS